MSAFWRRQPPPQPQGPPPPLEYRSHGLSFLLSDRPRGSWRILDLGPASNTNLTFFGGRGAVYAVEELWATLAPCRRAGRIDAACLQELPQLFTDPGGTPFDLILAWDLLDYLQPPALKVLGKRLEPLTAPGTRLHALTTMEPDLPARPARFTIADDHTIRIRLEPGPRALPSSRYTEPVLAQALLPFVPHKSYLLKHHMREHVLEVPRPSGE